MVEWVPLVDLHFKKGKHWKPRIHKTHGTNRTNRSNETEETENQS